MGKEVSGGCGGRKMGLLMWGMSLGGLNLFGECVRCVGNLKHNIRAKEKIHAVGVMNHCLEIDYIWKLLQIAMLFISSSERERRVRRTQDHKGLCFQVYATSQSMTTISHDETKPVGNVKEATRIE